MKLPKSSTNSPIVIPVLELLVLFLKSGQFIRQHNTGPVWLGFSRYRILPFQPRSWLRNHRAHNLIHTVFELFCNALFVLLAFSLFRLFFRRQLQRHPFVFIFLLVFLFVFLFVNVFFFIFVFLFGTVGFFRDFRGVFICLRRFRLRRGLFICL